MGPLPKKAHWPPAYIYFQSAAIAIAVWFMTRARYQDDAYITLSYARNLLAGNGLTLNPGEYVEGYSNFLFLILTALFGFIGIDMVLATRILSFASYFGLVFTIFTFVHNKYRRRFYSTLHAYAHRINTALCISLVASSAIVLAWCSGGMETVFFTFLLTICVCSVLTWLEYGACLLTVFLTGIIFALAAMTRIEAVLVWGVSGLFMGIQWLTHRESSKITFKQLLWLGLSFLLIFAPYMGWRFWYFGDWLPNTYYAKLFAIPPDAIMFPGVFYLFQFMVMPPMLPLFALGLTYMVARNRWVSPSMGYLLILVVVLCVSVVRSGGDHMFYLRFFVPVVPLLALMIYEMCGALIPRNEKRFRDLCGALLILSVLQFGMVRTDETESAGAASGIAVADYIKTQWPKGATIALNPMGALPYLAPNYYYIDMLGLTDQYIAHRLFTSPEAMAFISSLPIGHQKGDGAYILSRKPDYIIFGNASWGSSEPFYLSDREIVDSPEFADYERVETYITPPAKIMNTLKQMADASKELEKKNQNNPNFVRNPVLNDENQLRFIYYQRKKDGSQ